MSALDKELVFLILQFFNEEGFKETAHQLERETGCYFDMTYFEKMVLSGSWNEAERYLSGFTKIEDNRYSTKIYFEIRKQSFLEALDSKDRVKALDILRKDLKVFESTNEDLYKEMTQLLTFDDIREHDSLAVYGDTKSARNIMMIELKKVIDANPILQGKLKFPNIRSQRLRRLINQSLNWQHIQCANPCTNPVIKTLFEDHVCQLYDFLLAESTENNILSSQATTLSVSTPASRSSSPSTLTHSTLHLEAVSHAAPTDDPSTELLENSDISSKVDEALDEVMSTVSDPSQSHISVAPTSVDVPSTVALTLSEGSSPTMMDFHPVKQTFLLVGTSIGDIALWDLSYGKKLLSSSFRVWNIGACSMEFKAALVKDPWVSVNNIMWSPDGSLFGVAYSKHIVQLYSYSGEDDIQRQLEIDAHVGNVKDLAFSSLHGQIVVITCGDDKTVKVWDVVTGSKLFTFEGHEAPVYSVCPHSKENIDFVFSISMDGKIKAWLYDSFGARVDYDAPGLGCTKLAYSADGQRLFSCGTSKDGESFLVEWNESEGSIKRIYQGLQTCLASPVLFVTIKNQFLVAGDDHMIKFWDMDNSKILRATDAGGGLPVTPHICINKEGTLLAVVANENRIKILATNRAHHLLQTTDKHSVDSSSEIAETLRKLAINPSSIRNDPEVAEVVVPKNEDATDVMDSKSLQTGEALSGNKFWELRERVSPSPCRSLMLSAHVKANKISRLTYTNSGNAILALASNAFHLLWKWPKNEYNLTGKATTKVHPQLRQPKGGLLLMNNDLTDSNPKEAFPCFALAKNDSYLLSSSGGPISLFNTLTFKTMSTLMPPSPAATCIAFHPQDNNIFAIGMDDSSIVIYNIRSNKVKTKLEGHNKRVTGLAFSSTLNVLISSDADAEVITWNADGWQQLKSKSLDILSAESLEEPLDTYVQIHHDQLHFLIVNKTQLGIFDVKDLGLVKEWFLEAPPISHATFSCDSQMIFTCFVDGTIDIFDSSNLNPQHRIYPADYLPSSISWTEYPLVVAAHPQKPNQFAVGLTNGEVHILEPPEEVESWGKMPSLGLITR